MADFLIFEGHNFEIRVNSRRRRVSVGIDECGKYFIATPQSLSLSDLKQLIEPEIKKIITNIESKAIKKLEAKKYVTGEKFLYLGSEYTLIRADKATEEPLYLAEGNFIMSPSATGYEYSVFEHWYSRALYDYLKKELPKWTRALSVNPQRINIKTVKTLWGSCSSKGNITFCTRLALVPHKLLEYIIVHELSHMKEMNHSRRFWDEVEKYIPDYTERRQLLNKNSRYYVWW